MGSFDAAVYLAGLTQVENSAAESPTNVHVISGEVVEKSVDGQVLVNIDGLVFAGNDTQYIPISTLGGLQEGDIATIMLAGESGRAMTPLAIGGIGSVDRVNSIAEAAQESADYAQESAEAAALDAARAQESADIAQESARTAVLDAETAQLAAENALIDATNALYSAEVASRAAESASEDAAQAAADAASIAGAAALALERASEANSYAHGAFQSLSEVERVVGTVNWIADHGQYIKTEDTAVDATKAYYIRMGSGTDEDPYEYVVISPDGTENPAESEWYVLSVDESVTNYINTHLALMDDGLHVFSLDNGYYIVLASDGMYLYDPQSILVAKYGSDMQMGSLWDTHIAAQGNRMSFFTPGYTYPYTEDGQIDYEAEPSFYELTTDHRVIPRTQYYELIDGVYTKVVPEGDELPDELGWYTLTADGKFPGEVAYIAVDENGESVFNMNRAVVVSELRFGDWAWMQRANRNLTLKWRGK